PEKPSPLVAGPSPQTAGSAIDVAINQSTVGKRNRTITVKTEKTLALAYAGVSSGDDFGPRIRPETTAMVSRSARKAAKKPESFTVPAPSQAPVTAQNDDIIDYDLPSRPMPSEVAQSEVAQSEVAPSEEVVDFARFMGDDTTRTSTFAALEMPRPFAVPGFFTAPATIKAASQYQSNQPLRFDRFAATERNRPAVSRLAAVRLDY
ncbi:MAG TPA: hypothetical protein VKN63_04460, partial [Afifellaceae bacterium]|nr:hypothetical protein [Afifellaceae bacterium]